MKRILPIVLAVTALEAYGDAAPVQYAAGHVNSAELTNTSVSTSAFASNMTAGNALVAFVHYCDAIYSMPHNVALSGGGGGISWVEHDAEKQGAHWLHLFYALNIPGGSNAAITATISRNGHGEDVCYPSIFVVEVDDVAATSAFVDAEYGTQASPGTATDAVTTTTATVSSVPAIMVAMSYSGEGAPNAGTGFNSIAATWDYSGSMPEGRAEFRRITSAGNYAATWTAVVNEPHLSAAVVLLEDPDDDGGGDPEEPPAGGSTAPFFLLRQMR